MPNSKRKWYVVWSGLDTGVFETWEEAKRNIHGVSGARYQSFDSAVAAHEAYAAGPPSMAQSSRAAKKGATKPLGIHPEVPLPSFAVDAACDMTTGVMEYRGVDIGTGAEIFRMGPFADSSNNLGEFLAIVHCLGFCKQRGLLEPIFTDSRTALAWVRHKKAKTTVSRTAANSAVFDLITRAEQWLEKNTYPNTVRKWDTKLWGENPADFGRK